MVEYVNIYNVSTKVSCIVPVKSYFGGRRLIFDLSFELIRYDVHGLKSLAAVDTDVYLLHFNANLHVIAYVS